MKKNILIAAGIIIAVIVVLLLAKDMIIKVSVEKGVELVTGLPLSIRGFNVGVVRSVVNITDLKLLNPKHFKDRMMLDMPEIYVDYDLGAMLRGNVHLEKVRIDMKEFDVVKNEQGELNLNSLKVVQAKKEGASPQEKGGKAPSVKIDYLRLKIGKVFYKDYSKGGEPSVKEFDINIDETYTNINDPYSLVSLIVVKALMNTSIAGLANFDINGLKGTVSDTLATAQKNAQEAVAKVTETAQKASDAAKEAQDAIKKTTEDLSGAFSMFGSDKK